MPNSRGIRVRACRTWLLSRYMTLVEGIAGGTVDRANTGPRAPDGFNLWPALLSGGASPRTEVVHQVSNQHYDALNGSYLLPK